jgi:hypothetical protein
MGDGVRNSSVTVAGSVGTGESKTEPRTSTKCRLRDGSSPIAFRNTSCPPATNRASPGPSVLVAPAVVISVEPPS